jgi:hypothetical protein
MDDTSFSLRHNAKRAADRMIEAGRAPSIDYGVRARNDGSRLSGGRAAKARPPPKSRTKPQQPNPSSPSPRSHQSNPRLAKIPGHPGRR